MVKWPALKIMVLNFNLFDWKSICKFPIKIILVKKLNRELETTKLTLKQVYSKNISIGKFCNSKTCSTSEIF